MAEFFMSQAEQNYIKRILSTPCDPTPGLWVEAAIPAVLKAAFSFAKPDFKEGIKLTTGESWLGSAREGLLIDSEAQPKFSRSAKAEMVGAYEAEATTTEKALRNVFKFGEVIDQTAWWAFIASIAQDAAIDAATNVLEISGCDFQGRAGSLWSDEPWGAVSTTHYSAAGDWWYYKNGQLFETAPEISVAAGQGGHLAMSMTVSLPFGGPGGVSLQFVRHSDGAIIDSDQTTIAPDGLGVIAPKVFGRAQVFSNRDEVYSIQAMGFPDNGLHTLLITGGELSLSSHSSQ